MRTLFDSMLTTIRKWIHTSPEQFAKTELNIDITRIYLNNLRIFINKKSFYSHLNACKSLNYIIILTDLHKKMVNCSNKQEYV